MSVVFVVTHSSAVRLTDRIGSVMPYISTQGTDVVFAVAGPATVCAREEEVVVAAVIDGNSGICGVIAEESGALGARWAGREIFHALVYEVGCVAENWRGTEGRAKNGHHEAVFDGFAGLAE